MRQPKKKVHVPYSQRKRALFSCDRCKSKKRACKRFLNGKQIFDDTTPCDSCVRGNATCTVTIPRKERKYFPVSKTTLKQLRYLVGIVKAMFPECDPENLQHLKKVAEGLFVQIPIEESDDSDDETEESEISDPVRLEQRTDTAGDHGIVASKIKIDDQLKLKARERAQINKESKLGLKSESSNSLHSEPDITVKRSEESVRTGPSQIALGGADRLFKALLKISSDEATNAEADSSFFMHKPAHVPTSMPLRVNGVDVHKSLILNLLSPQECELYIDVFFDKLHKSYLVLNERRFRLRHSQFLLLMTGRTDNLGEFCNEEICEIYLVWILGRNCLLAMRHQNPNSMPFDVAPNSVMDQYFEVTVMCFSGSLFSNNIHCIRVLYLMGLHCTTIMKKEVAWQIFVNCCLKMAGMGLNRESNLSKYNEEYREEVRVLWWSSFKLHMNNCAMLGKLPNVTLYDVDLAFPKLRCMNDLLFKEIYMKSLELFKIMFKILKNREDLSRNRNPWCQENLNQVSMINDSLKSWAAGASDEMKLHDKPNIQRYIIKLHLQYHYCVTCLIAPYLMAVVVNPLKSRKLDPGLIETLCHGMGCAVKLVKVVESSVKSGYFNGMLHYDMFYAYNSLMLLLLAYKVFLGNNEQFDVIKRELVKSHGIDSTVIFSSIMEIKGINERYGGNSGGDMRGFSNNISILLKYFGFAGSEEGKVDGGYTSEVRQPTTETVSQAHVDVNNPTDTMKKGFFEFINHINTATEGTDSTFNDQLLLDWNKLFGLEDDL